MNDSQIHAAITGWGKCLPPAVLSNTDLATFLDTDDEWISSRTGMKERRVSHVTVGELSTVACQRALAAAGRDASDVELIIFGSTSFDEMAPNAASGVQARLGASNAACIDLNTACTSGMYSLSVATSMIRTGVVNSALVIGAEVVSQFMDWDDRNVAVLFGDGAAAFYLEATDKTEGVIAEALGCYGESRGILSITGWGTRYANQGIHFGETDWTFNGQEIFKRAVSGMGQASAKALEKAGLGLEDVDLVVPHQANLRIIDFLAKRMKLEGDRLFVNVERYGNMSAATAPVALIEAVEENRVQPGSLILIPAFGAGLTWSAHLLRWGERVEPLGESDAELPECTMTGLELVENVRKTRASYSVSKSGD